MRVEVSSLMMVIAMLASLSCGGGSDSSIGVNNVSPRGSVGGLIVDASTLKPMQGVAVSIVAGGRIYPDNPAETDDKGYFAVNDVPCGDLIVRIAPKQGFLAADLAATLVNAAGDYPLANATLSLGPIGLLPAATQDTAFKVLLVKPDGTPPNPPVTIYLRTAVAWVDLSTGQPVGKGVVVSETKCDNGGLARFNDMPDFYKLGGLVGSGGISDAVRVTIPPIDAGKDGAADFLGKEVGFQVTKLGGAIPTVVLSSGAANALQIIATNIAGLMGKQGNRLLPAASGPIYIAFNWPIVEKLTELSLYDESGKPVASAPTKSINGSQMTINFQGLAPQAEYNLNIHTFGDAEGSYLEGNFAAPIFTPIGAKVQATLKRDGKLANRIWVTFNEPIGAGVANQGLPNMMFFDFDLSGSGSKGDAPAERGYMSSNIGLAIEEVDPPGAVGRSGYSTQWTFDLPLDSFNNPVPGGTYVDLLFSRGAAQPERADGTLVPDLPNLTIPN